MNKKINVAVIGAGVAAKPHILSLSDLAAEAEFSWCYSRTQSKLQELAKQLAVPPDTRLTTSMDSILGDPAVRAVLVLTPANAHLDVVRRAAQAGKHVLVEKPLEVDLQKAQEMVAVCGQHGVTLAVMFQHRLRDGAVALRTLIQNGELGTLISGSATARWWRPQSYYDEPGRGTLARDGGGVLMTQAIHTIDLLLSLTGMPDRVIGLVATSPVHRMETEDTAAALLHFANGAIVTLEATTAAYPGYAEKLALNFTGGTATLESGELVCEFADGRQLTVGEKQSSGSGANIMGFDHGAHRTVIADFLGAIREGREPQASGRSALNAQRLIDAIVESSRLGSPL
ncbi:MAG: Gfo/Idh/MocA family oxidoreductase [Bdellovibrionales bacterium]|nr:Gfo/Idh/MocA family oxidoreductase [Ramlibacter sp.]